MNLSTPALVTLGLVGGLLAFSVKGTGSGSPRPTPIPGPTPLPDYSTSPPPGTSGSADVLYLQQVLNAIERKYSLVLFTPLVEDGLLGPATTAAVRETLTVVWEVLEKTTTPSQADSVLLGVPGIGPGPSADSFDPLVTNASSLAEWLNGYVLVDGSLLT